ncbi:UPF0705 protein C11orf49 homolog [Dendronephthya gigantea]|uniref:UPF0705 protein C11orf49 homolog n=1 Tax=Dendronephthya gigantea TaxID=151771 RepID=UPI00106D8BE1|nr:UPF0705 protein C11orf49 homolog [Dendronephthya gigantea]
MDTERNKMQLSDEKYLAKHNVLIYIQDAVSQLLQHKEDNPHIVPAKFLNDYFKCVVQGNHTLYREYSFIHATPHNRSSFIAIFWKCFKHIGQSGDLLSVKEYHSLLSLICSDFPYEIVQKSARIVLMEDAMDCLMSFSDFVTAFQMQLYYEEFLAKCSEIYEEVASGSHRSGQVVVVPTSDSKSKHRKSNEKVSQLEASQSLDGVDSISFYDEILHHVVHHSSTANTISIPPTEALKQILSSADRVTFYGFLMALAKNDLVNQTIGAVSQKNRIADDDSSDR